ncbi:hypothetical protein TSUD_125080 [Trifolium subterraneum]|uniref:DUF247 domain protein n=1 Tax=Trifolium subterraneum TaxID=3900 RepID=A0A2Z6MR19_TRISU|nr:hypothetical protein TSUD_125080 [Trifolium subterraneum]
MSTTEVETKDQKTRHDKWKETTKALLGAVRKETCQPYSIPVVPDDLRKSNETAYMPKVVSIGPRYKGKKELLPMEEIKWRCVTSLLSRTFGQDRIDNCLEAVINLDATVRVSYVDVIALDRYELAKTMVFDGCFLLELLICESKLDLEIPIPFNGISPGIEVKKMEYVVSDLMLLENQIPIFILETLFEKLLGSSNQMREFIQNLALPLFGYSGKLMGRSTSHFLDVAYSYIEMEWTDKPGEENDTDTDTNLTMLQALRLHRCATRQEAALHRCATRQEAAGITITIKPLNKNDDPSPINFKFTTQFDKSKGILQIPTLIIKQTTEVKWRSFIAWEHHKKKLKTSSSSVADRRSICTSSALLFRDLICCSSDVQLIEDHTNKSNRDLVAFFHSIASGVDVGIMDHKHTTMFLAMNEFPTKSYLTKIWILLIHYFGKTSDWYYRFYKFLKRGYNLAAAIVTFLTVVQTCYAVLAYHFPM